MLASPSKWLTSICSVIFDIDVGQRLEDVYPPESLSPDDGTNIAMHSFPVSEIICVTAEKAQKSAVHSGVHTCAGFPFF